MPKIVIQYNLFDEFSETRLYFMELIEKNQAPKKVLHNIITPIA